MGVDLAMTSANTRKNKKTAAISPEFINFVKSNILNISQISRSTKITEILDGFAEDKTEIFIIENSKKKNAKGALISLDYLQVLLEYGKIIEDIIDTHMYKIALERQDDTADIPLAQIIADNGLDIDEILVLADEIEDGR